MVILFTGSSLLCLNAPDLGNDLLLRLNLRSIIIRVTADIGGTAGTKEFTQAVIARL